MTDAPDDPLIVPVDDIIEVVMLPGHAMAYQRWLAEHDLHLFPIPWTEDTAHEPHIPAYGVGVRFPDSAATDRRQP